MPTEEQPTAAPRHRPLRIEQSPLERARLWVEILAFVAAGLWAVYTFVYQTNIAPLLETAHELVTGNVTRIGSTRSTDIERVQLTVMNNGHVAVDTAGVAINLYGLHDAATETGSTERRRGDATVDVDSGSPHHWVVLGTHSELDAAAHDGPPDRHVILSPGDSAQFEFITAVPHGHYAALRLDADTVYVRYPTHAKVLVELRRDKNGAESLHESKQGAQGFGVQWIWYFAS